jgi:dGTPase
MKSGVTFREQYEAAMRDIRAAYAVNEADAGPRAHPEEEHAYRTCFQRDRDRILHCSAFRRLDFKTQVFVPHEHDHFRTRMTHTLEVAQLARDLARALRLNEDLSEAVALAHDLGHPPFGHAGEGVLDELMSACGGFEHNRQSLRVVDYLEHPYPEFRGLNLTRAVRECLTRHETRYDQPVSSEFPSGEFGPLEGQLVDAADEIAYTAADIDDALGSGMLTRDQLARLPLWRLAWAAAEREHPDAREIHKQIRATKGVLALLADDLLQTTRMNLSAAGVATLGHVRSGKRRLVRLSEDARIALDEMQDYLMRHVYAAGVNAEREADATRILRELFAAYLADPSRLPARYARRIDDQGLHRVVCDYIAGMTDRFCRDRHAEFARMP